VDGIIRVGSTLVLIGSMLVVLALQRRRRRLA
jgi:hypothetical protein